MGRVHGPHWTPDTQVFPPLGGHSTTDGGRHERPLPNDIEAVLGTETPVVPISALGMGGGPMASHECAVGEHRWGMRPAGAGRPAPQKPIVDRSEERGIAAVRPLSVGAAEFAPALGHRTRETDGTRFSAVAEVHSSAVDDDHDTSVVRASEQRSDVSLFPRMAPGIVGSSMAGISVPEPLEHSVLDVDLDGRPMEGLLVPEPLEHSVLDVTLDGRPRTRISVPEPLEHSVLEVDLDGRPMTGISVPEPLEHSVLEVDLDGRPMEGISVPEPLEHSVLDVALERKSMDGMSALEPLEHSVLEMIPDGRPTREISVMEPLEHLVPDVAPVRGASSFIRMVVSNPLEHSGLHRIDDVGPGLVPLEPLEHSVLVASREESDVSVTDVAMEHSVVEMRLETKSACLPRVFSDHRVEDVSLLDVRPEAKRE